MNGESARKKILLVEDEPLIALSTAGTTDFFPGKTFRDIYPKEHADRRLAAIRKVFRTGESRSAEVVVPLPDRDLRFLAKASGRKT